MTFLLKEPTERMIRLHFDKLMFHFESKVSPKNDGYNLPSAGKNTVNPQTKYPLTFAQPLKGSTHFTVNIY